MAARKLAKEQREERERLKAFLALPHTGEVHWVAHYARRLQRRLDEDRADYRMQKRAFAEDLNMAVERQHHAEAGASFRWEAEALAFRTALKVLNLDAEALLKRYLPGAEDYLKKQDPIYGGKVPAVAAKAVADPTDVLVHGTEKEMTDG